MSVSATIITFSKTDALLVPSSAIITVNNEAVVRTLKNNQLVNIPVVTGSTNGTQTEIVSGVNEGDSIVTSVINSASTTKSATTTTTTSPFSGITGGGARGGIGGGGFRGN